MTPEEILVSCTEQLESSFDKYRDKVPWEWFRDSICSLYTVSVIRSLIKKRSNMLRPDRKRTVALEQLRQIWEHNNDYQFPKNLRELLDRRTI